MSDAIAHFPLVTAFQAEAIAEQKFEPIGAVPEGR
jgi:hypothetical protein